MTTCLTSPAMSQATDTKPAQRRPSSEPGSAPALELRNITLDYPDGVYADGTPRIIRALDDISITARSGDLTALTGSSGSGKSSLLSVAAGLTAPTGGSRFIGGTDTTAYTDTQLAELRRTSIGIIFQQPNLIPSLTAAEQLELAARITGLKGSQLTAARTHANDLLDLVGLKDARNRRPHQLSGGQRQRVNIARALMGSPVLLLADEPTSALDTHRSADIIDLLTTLTTEFNTATLIITHDPDHTRNAHQTLTLSDGKLTRP